MRPLAFSRVICLILFAVSIPTARANTPHELKFCSSGTELRSARTIGRFTVKIYYANDRMCQRLEILKNGRVEFLDQGIGNHYSLEKLIPGNQRGNSQIVISNWSGGAHCCTSILIFELGRELKKIAEVEGGNFKPELVDLDHDGKPEIVVTDDFLAYVFSSFASSATARVILKAENGKYVIAKDLMRRPPPSSLAWKKRIPAWRVEIKQHGPEWPPPDFIQELTNLVFTDNATKARAFVDLVWPGEVSGKHDFLREYKEALIDSRYYSAAAKQIDAD